MVLLFTAHMFVLLQSELTRTTVVTDVTPAL